MKKNEKHIHERRQRDFGALRLTYIPEVYQETLDEAASKGWSTLQTFAYLIGLEAIHHAERAIG